MRRARVFAWFAAATGIAAGAACVDLFHSTDFPTACADDASIPGCTPAPSGDAASDAEAGPPPTNFCSWSQATAEINARHACAWLSACMGPLGDNAFGECMFNARLAYDCTANPNRRLRQGLPMHAYWDCLWQATTCDAVKRCVLPSGDENCKDPFKFTACGIIGRNTPVRVQCEGTGLPTMAASCLATGQTCIRPDLNRSRCASNEQCKATACNGTVLETCVDSGVVGVDCAYFGEGKCVDVGGGSSPSCQPLGATKSCTPTPALTCSGGVVTGCPTGFEERVDCKVLTGGGCNGNVPGRPDDIARACTGPGPDAGGDGGPCKESCADGLVHSCAHGTEYKVKCSDVGLGPCTVRPTVQDGDRATCTPP